MKSDEAVNNKLHEIHPKLGLWPGGFRIIRHEESVLVRIRIGHTYLTHCFLLKKEDPPQYVACDCRLTVKPILFGCVDFIGTRNRHFNVNTYSLKRFLQTAFYLIYMRSVCFTGCKTF